MILENYEKGIYFLQLSTKEGNAAIRFVKQEYTFVVYSTVTDFAKFLG